MPSAETSHVEEEEGQVAREGQEHQDTLLQIDRLFL
jgi:hypothetical protein